MGMSFGYYDKEGKGVGETEGITVIHRCVTSACQALSVRHGLGLTRAPKLLRRAKELGVTFLDTSDAYGPHTNEVRKGSGGSPCSAHAAVVAVVVPVALHSMQRHRECPEN